MYKCGAYNPVTGEVKVEPYGTKLLVKSKPGVKNTSKDVLYGLHVPHSSSPSQVQMVLPLWG